MRNNKWTMRRVKNVVTDISVHGHFRMQKHQKGKKFPCPKIITTVKIPAVLIGGE